MTLILEMTGNMNIKSFREYLTETESADYTPSAGDVFEIEIAREEMVLETVVVGVVDDGIVIEADETMMRILMHVGYLTEDSNMPTANDIRDSPSILVAKIGFMIPRNSTSSV